MRTGEAGMGISGRRVGRWARRVAMVVPVVLAAQLGGVGFPLPLLPGGSPAFADPSAPVPPPAPVDPAPSVQVVTTPGPTWVPDNTVLTTDTVWGPQGSPYVVNHLTITNGSSLTLLPGTVVKLDS